MSTQMTKMKQLGSVAVTGLRVAVVRGLTLTVTEIRVIRPGRLSEHVHSSALRSGSIVANEVYPRRDYC